MVRAYIQQEVSTFFPVIVEGECQLRHSVREETGGCLSIGAAWWGSGCLSLSMVNLMGEPLPAAERIVAEVLVNVADKPMFACSARDDAIGPCGMPTVPHVVVGLASWILTVALWWGIGTWITVMVRSALEVNLSREERIVLAFCYVCGVNFGFKAAGVCPLG